MIDTDEYEEQIEFDYVLTEIEVGVDISEGNYDILRYYRDEYKDLLAEVKRLRELLLPRIDEGYTTSYMDLRKIIEDVHWELTGDVHESNEERIKYALIALRDVIG